MSEKPFVLEVIAGQPDAVLAGIIVGSKAFSNSALVNKLVQVVRGNVIIPGIDPLNGGQFYKKIFENDLISFSSPIQDTEYIKIEAL